MVNRLAFPKIYIIISPPIFFVLKFYTLYVLIGRFFFFLKLFLIVYRSINLKKKGKKQNKKEVYILTCLIQET